MVRTQVQLTEGQSEAVKRLSVAAKVSVAEIVRRSVDAYVRTNGRPPDDDRWRRALEAVGIVKDGPTDMARRHDDYALESYRS